MVEELECFLSGGIIGGCPDGLAGNESACSAGDMGDAGLIPGSRRSPGEGNGNPLQYYCLENPMDILIAYQMYDLQIFSTILWVAFSLFCL